jgi:hypothetical protein
VARALRAPPAAIVEPTCGVGAFLAAARERFPSASLHGYELNERYVALARAAVEGAAIERADFFETDWCTELAALPDPLVVVGNPPWVTAAGLGALDARNLPAVRDASALTGLDARTGRSNFDVSEWMLQRLIEALQHRRATVAVLCKSSVARRLLERAALRGPTLRPAGLWRIDARAHFDAAVDACLFVFETAAAGSSDAPVYAGLDAAAPRAHLGVAGGALVPDVAAWRATEHLAGACEPEWRSGLKHDCARVMELTRRDGAWVNGLGAAVDVEDAVRLPLLKGSDVARGARAPHRSVLVTQRRLGDDTGRLAREAPRAWAYLTEHRALFEARRSSIYRGQCAYAVFGVGPYSFAPWKVAISGLHKRLGFALVGPHEGRPVLFDDTCYFAPFAGEEEAREALARLTSAEAAAFFEARVFWDAKRPVHKALLQSLDLAKLAPR